MKSTLTVLAMTLCFLAQTASAQQGRDHGKNNDDRDRGTQQNNNNYNDDRDAQQSGYYNNDRNTPDYGSRRVRNDHRGKIMMTDRAFRQAMVSIRQESFDSDKIRLARSIVFRNNMTTAQIRTIAQLMSFDASKLEFTKYAYTSCIDPQNYYQIGRVFSFTSSRRELYDYLARV